MSDVIGFDNTKEKEHRLSNSLDGKLDLNVFVDKAVGKTCVFVNGIETEVLDAQDGKSPFYCGVVSIPRGEFTLSVESECEISRILLSETLTEISTRDEFEIQYTNRAGQGFFMRDVPEFTPEMIETLRRHGFLFDHMEDCGYGTMPSGIPLGGIGCGKVELCADGMFTAFSGNNNQDSPIFRLPGSFFALSAEGKTRIFRKDTLELPYTCVESAKERFEFPFAKIDFSDSELPVTASVHAFAPHIPNNVSDSALPVALFEVTLKNISDTHVYSKFTFSWENIINVGGSMNVTNRSDRLFPPCYHNWNSSFVWSDRRENYCEYKDGALRFSAHSDAKNPMSFGEHMLWCSDENAVAIPDRSIMPDSEKAFEKFLSSDSLDFTPDSDSSEFRAGAFVVPASLSAGEEKRVRFILSWYMPSLYDKDGTEYGVEYVNRYSNVREIVDYARDNWERLYNGTREVNDIINRSTLPEWFKLRLLDDRFAAVTCSWYDKNGDFSINESPSGMSGCLGTLDQRTASQGYYTAFFPELDENEIDLFRRAQAADGMCSHELGFAAIKFWVRSIKQWPDLVSAYIIQVYHYYQRTGDVEFLKLNFPHIKKAIDWTLTLDDLDIAIPFICAGRGTTYDNQFWEGINAFISTMQIASYKVGAAAARALGETECEEKWEALAVKANDYRMKHLWNEDEGYFRNAYDPKKNEYDESCFIASFAGEWAALRAGIDTFISKEVMAKSTANIARECIGDKGMSDQGGRREETPAFHQYPFAYLASVALYSDNSAPAWRFAEICEKVITQPGISTHFDQALTYRFDGSRFGLPYYMTAPASWNMLEALTGLVVDCAKGKIELSLKSRGRERLPVFLPYTWFEIMRNGAETEIVLSPIKAVRPYTFNTIILDGIWTSDRGEVRYENSKSIIRVDIDLGRETLTLKKA